MRKLRFVFLGGFILLIQQISVAQLPDGVTATTAYVNEIIKNYADENSSSYDVNADNISANIAIRVHVIKNIKGLAGVYSSDIYNSVSNINSYFKTIGIRFFVDSIDYVNDYNYSYITGDKYKTELLTKHAKANRINLFLADSINMNTFRSYGFTYFPIVTDSSDIFLDKTYLSGNSLTTMMGHFMGLLSTHETLGGAELVSEKNCATSGDFLCDTYADPNLYDQIKDTCIYKGTAKDSNGKYYVPSVANIMSNSLSGCKCSFTPLQYRRMYYYYRKYRQYLNY
jgi:hypothetical protein